MNQTQSSPEDFSQDFQAAFARLQILIEEACRTQQEWPTKVTAAIGAGLNFAVRDPASAQTLANRAVAHGSAGIACHERLIGYLSRGLAPGRGERPEGEHLPEITERAMVGGVVSLIAQRVDRGRGEELPAIAAEVTQFVLTPYLGVEEARRVGIEYST